MCFVVRTSGDGFRGLSFVFRTSGDGFRVLCFVFRTSGFGVRVSCFVFRVSGFVSRVLGLVFRVSGFGGERECPLSTLGKSRLSCPAAVRITKRGRRLCSPSNWVCPARFLVLDYNFLVRTRCSQSPGFGSASMSSFKNREWRLSWPAAVRIATRRHRLCNPSNRVCPARFLVRNYNFPVQTRCSQSFGSAPECPLSSPGIGA